MGENLVNDTLHTSTFTVPDCQATTTTTALGNCGEKLPAKDYFIASQDGQNFVQVSPDSINDLLTQQYLVYYVDEITDSVTIDGDPSVSMTAGPSSYLFLTQYQPVDSISTDRATKQLSSCSQTQNSNAPSQLLVPPLQSGILDHLSSDSTRLSAFGATNVNDPVRAVATQATVRFHRRNPRVRICPVCGIRFSNKKLYVSHMTTHERERPFKCSYCESTFNYDVNRAIHEILQHHRDPPYTCPVCSIESVRWFAFKSHLLLHQLEDVVFCSICSKSFESPCLLEAHTKLEHTSPGLSAVPIGYHCRICRTLSPTLAKLRQHYRAYHPSEPIHKRTVQSTAYKPQPLDNNPTPVMCVTSSTEGRNPRLSKSHFRIFMKNTFPSRRTKKVVPIDNFIRQLEVEPLTETQSQPIKRRKRRSCRTVPRTYSCEFCGKKFAKPAMVRRHSLQHINEKPFQCLLCDITFAQKSTARSHVLARHQPKPRLSCPFCPRHYFSTTGLTRHMQSRHGVASYDCLPSSRLNTNSVLGNLVATEFRPQTDTVYSHVLADSTHAALTRCSTHITSDKIQVGACESMSAEFPDVSCDHYNCITNPITAADPDGTSQTYRPYQCSICPKSFSSATTLSVHMLRHPTSPLPFACHLCPLRFTTSSDLAHHVRSHALRSSYSTMRLRIPRLVAPSHSPLKWNRFSQCFLSTRRIRSDRSFKCTLCSRSYGHFVHLKYHIRQSHCPDQAPFECGKCSKRFVNERRLANHLNNVHASCTPQSKLECSICSSHFATISSLKRHMVIHSDSKLYKCHMCHKMFRFHSSCSKHIKTHSSNTADMPTCSENNDNFEHLLHVVDLDADLRETHSVLDCGSAAFVPDLSTANEEQPVDQPKQAYVYTYFTDIQTELCPTNTVTYHTVRGAATEARLQQDTVGNCGDSLLYTSLSDTDGATVRSTNAALVQCHSIVAPSDIGAITTGHTISGGTHTISQVTDCKSPQTKSYIPEVAEGVSATEPHENVISCMHGNSMYEESTMPLLHQIGLPSSIVDSSIVTNTAMNSAKEPVVSQVVFNSCCVNSQPVSPQSADFTIRSAVRNQSESKLPTESPLFFGCGICHASFDSSHRLATHVQLSHSIRPKPFQCDICGLHFASETLLVVHKRKHSDVTEAGNSCPSCPLLEFGNKSALTRHILLCHPLPTPDRFRCTHCNMRFRLLCSLKAHVAGLVDAVQQFRDKRIEDDESPKQLLNASRKCRRRRIPMVNTNLLRSAAQQAQLPKKLLSLSEKYLMKCVPGTTVNSGEQCASEGVTSGLNGNTVEDNPIRTKSYLCSTCGRSFASLSILKHHVRAHLGIRPYGCQYCDKKFTKNCLLQRHVTRVHTTQQHTAGVGANPQEAARNSCPVGFRCHLCNRTLLSRNSLRCHVQRHAISRNYKCPHCRTCFKSWRQRQLHLCDCHVLNGNTQEPPGFHCAEAIRDAHAGYVETILAAPHGPRVDSQNTLVVPCGEDPSSVPLIATFLAKDINQAMYLSDGANLLLPVQLIKEGPPIHTDSVSPTFSSHVPIPFISEREDFGSNEVISVVDLSQSQSFVQTAFQLSEPPEVLNPSSSVSASYNEAIYCHLCHAKFTDNRAYSRHYCAKSAILQTQSTHIILQPKLTERSHRRRHFRPKRFPSPGSGRSFRRLHKCSVCSREFYQAYLLKRHERTHTNNRPFVCTICGASFSQSYSLTTHSLIHADAKPYACTRCDRGFRQKSNLQRHVKLVHSSETK